jgi:peptide chain release factor 2
MKAEIEAVSAKTAAPDFWQNREDAEAVLNQLNRLRGKYEPWEALVTAFGDFADLYELALTENDVTLEADIAGELESLEKKYEDLNLLSLLGQENDDASAFLTIHSGAGGTEACDWVSMLLRMYTRWSEEHEYKCEIIDLMEAEGGIKSVTMEVKGEYAYGFLKAETGIHRLVRISPFDSSSRRHTSFASLSCSPVLDDSIDVEIKPDDIRVDTYRSAGAGGQHVNKTDSAVRITHFPTGIVVQCQNERSQHKNKAMAMAVLRSRLYEHYRREQDKERRKLEKEKKEIAWGNQIRSYVFHPYSMVKDHRTKHETGNIQAVMDGEVDPFIEAYLRMVW